MKPNTAETPINTPDAAADPASGTAFAVIIPGCESSLSPDELSAANDTGAWPVRLAFRSMDESIKFINAAKLGSAKQSVDHGGEAGAEAPKQPAPLPAPATNERQLPLFLTVEEAASILRLSNRKALYTKIERGQVEGVVRQGAKILFERDAFLRGLKRRSK